MVLTSIGALAGRVVRAVLVVGRQLPVTVGVLAVVAGLYQAWQPLGWIGLGTALILSDWASTRGTG